MGQYAIQVLAYYGYRNIMTSASPKHHETMRSLGASAVFNYRAPTVVGDILDAARRPVGAEPSIPLILDCIGSLKGSVEPIAKLAQSGSRVAVLLPVIVRDSTEDMTPEYAMDVQVAAPWAGGVDAVGVRTHFYLKVSHCYLDVPVGIPNAKQNEFFRQYLQSSIMPTMLAEGIIKPNPRRVVEGSTLLDRAQKSIDMLRRKEASGERLVWRVADT